METMAASRTDRTARAYHCCGSTRLRHRNFTVDAIAAAKGDSDAHLGFWFGCDLYARHPSNIPGTAMIELVWKTTKRHAPYGPLHVGFLGRIPVASVEDENPNIVDVDRFPSKDQFNLSFSLPPKAWRAWHNPSVLSEYRCGFAKLDKAKAAAERIVSRWLKDAHLERSQ